MFLIKYICLKDFVANGREWSDLTKALRRAPWDNDPGAFAKRKIKSGLISYLETFESLELAFQKRDDIAHNIPADLHGNPDGAHRIACAMLNNHSVSLRKT